MQRFAGADLILTQRQIRIVWASLGALLFVRLAAMVTLPFTDTTESRYAEMARKMVETGNWLTPQDAYGVPFWGKPPLNTWLSAGGMEAFGINEFAARLPILVCSLLILWLVWRMTVETVGRNTGLVAVAVLASMVAFFGAAAFVMTDIPMTLGTTLVMAGFWLGVCGDAPRRGWGYAVFLGLAVGMLAKGPVAVVICIIPLLIWTVLRGEWRALGRLPWLGGTALLLVLAVPWYAAAEWATPGFLRYFIIGEHIERFLVPGWKGDLYGSGHDEARGLIWVFWTGAIRPWSYLALIPLVWRGRRTVGAMRGDGSGWMTYLLLWAISPLILFTLAANILPAYTIPGLPASAILLVVLYTRIWGADVAAWRRYIFAGGIAMSLAFFGAVAILADVAPDILRLKSHKVLVDKVQALAPGAPLYRVDRRSNSAQFYTGGKVTLIPLKDVPGIAADGPVALSVPDADADAIDSAKYQRIGQYGRGNVLFLSKSGE